MSPSQPDPQTPAASPATGDELVSALLPGADLRVVLAVTTGLSRHARDVHQALPAAGALLAQGLTAAALLAALQKTRSRVNVQLECDGPLRGLFADADGVDGWVRGYPKNPFVAAAGASDEWRWRPALGNSGFLSVLRDLGGGEYYRSSVELEHFELARDLERYFETSEQLPTRALLEVRPGSAGGVGDPGETLGRVVGVLLQPLPGGDRARLDALAQRLRDGGLARALEAAPADERAGALLARLFSADGENAPLDVMSRYPLRFACTCSRERVRAALTTMGRAELEDILAKDGEAKADCHFCATQYVIGADELRELIAKAAG